MKGVRLTTSEESRLRRELHQLENEPWRWPSEKDQKKIPDRIATVKGQLQRNHTAQMRDQQKGRHQRVR
ncbi:MAG: hypothetical protein V4681_02565 [Patescibacteria group bacterium]